MRTKYRKEKELIPIDVENGYALWANSYPPRAHNFFMEAEEDAMLKLFPSLDGLTCLDLACGSGRYLLHQKKQQATQIFGTDRSREMLLKAKEACPTVELSRSNFLHLPFLTQSFDFVTCGLAVGHVENLKQVMREISRILVAGGVVVYSDMHPFGALVGWNRDFIAADGKTYSLEHHIHLYSEHVQACREAGLTIDAVLEPLSGLRGDPQYSHFPLVLVIRAVKQLNNNLVRSLC